MIRDVTIVNYCNRNYELYINEEVLYLKEGNTLLNVASSIKAYKASYLDNIIWIACKKKEHISVYKVILNAKEDIKLSINTIIDYKSIYKNIVEISLIVDKIKSTLIVSAKDTLSNRGYIFEIKLYDKITTNIISSCDVKALNELNVCTIAEKSYILICKDKEKGEYILYDIFNEQYIRSIHIEKGHNVKMIKLKDKIILYYWEEGLAVKEIKGIQLSTDETVDTKIVECINLQKEIKEPIIFSYLSKIYILAKSKGNIYLYYSKDNIEWGIKKLKYSNSMKQIVMLKAINEIVWQFIAYTEINEEKYVVRFIEEKHLNLNNHEKIKRLENDKLNMLNNVINMDKYYVNICSKYTEKIAKLIRLIDEKDEIITKLLEIK